MIDGILKIQIIAIVATVILWSSAGFIAIHIQNKRTIRDKEKEKGL